MSKLLKTVILGAPASGKGTISTRIISKFNFEHISVGDKLRLEIKNNTSLGIEAKKYVSSGALLPDSLVTQFVNEQIRKLGTKTWLLDGFPRSLSQAEALWELHHLDLVLNLDVPFDVIISRAKNRWVHLPSGRVYNLDFNAPKVFGKDDVTGDALVQRNDDRPEVLMKRLEVYDRLTKPVLDFYQKFNILQSFSGRTSDEIWPQIVQYLNEFLGNAQVVKKQA